MLWNEISNKYDNAKDQVLPEQVDTKSTAVQNSYSFKSINQTNQSINQSIIHKTKCSRYPHFFKN